MNERKKITRLTAKAKSKCFREYLKGTDIVLLQAKYGISAWALHKWRAVAEVPKHRKIFTETEVQKYATNLLQLTRRNGRSEGVAELETPKVEHVVEYAGPTTPQPKLPQQRINDVIKRHGFEPITPGTPIGEALTVIAAALEYMEKGAGW